MAGWPRSFTSQRPVVMGNPHIPFIPMGPEGQQYPPMNQFPVNMGNYPLQGNYPPPPHLQMMPPPPPHQLMMQQVPMYSHPPPIQPQQPCVPWQQEVRILRDPYQGGYINPPVLQSTMTAVENGNTHTINNGVENENKQKEREEQERLAQGINPAPPSSTSHNVTKDLDLMLFSSTAGAQQQQQQRNSEILKSSGESIFVSQSSTVNSSNYTISSNLNDNYDNDNVECSESDSGESIGGDLIADLTGDEDGDDENLKILDSDDDKTKRLKTLKRRLLMKENEIIKFWLNRRPENPELKHFPDVFKLRDKDVENSAKAVFKSLFSYASVPNYLRPVFENPPNSRPDLGHYFIRLNWNNLKNTVHAYGKSIDSAENSAAILGLKQILGEEEYENIVRIQKATKEEGINVQRIQNHLLQKWKKSRSRKRKFQVENKNEIERVSVIDFEVLNPPDTLIETTDFTKLLKPELQMRVKSRRRLNSETWKNSTKPTNPNILQKLTDVVSPVIALGAFMSAKSLPIPDYITVKYTSKVKVECVVDGKFFTAEAPTEEEAKLKSAGIALKFFIGNSSYEKWKQNKL